MAFLRPRKVVFQLILGKKKKKKSLAAWFLNSCHVRVNFLRATAAAASAGKQAVFIVLGGFGEYEKVLQRETSPFV